MAVLVALYSSHRRSTRIRLSLTTPLPTKLLFDQYVIGLHTKLAVLRVISMLDPPLERAFAAKLSVGSKLD